MPTVIIRIAILLALIAVPSGVAAQSTPGLIRGAVPTAAQWNSYFGIKQDVLGYVPVNKAGDTMLGRLVTLASATTGSGFNLPAGVAPTSPVDGDFWTTTAGAYVRINGGTIGPLAGATGNAGGSTGQIQWNSAGTLAGFTMGGDCTFSQPNITCTKTGGTSLGALATLGVGTGLASSGGNLVFAGVSANTWMGALTAVAPTPQAWTSCSSASSAVIYTNGTGTGCRTDVPSLTAVDQALSGGANVTAFSIGTVTTGTTTIDCGKSPLQYFTNGGASTIAAPSNDGSCMVKMTNNGSAGAISFSGFNVGANTGSALTTVNTNVFTISIWRNNSVSGYTVFAHQ